MTRQGAKPNEQWHGRRSAGPIGKVLMARELQIRGHGGELKTGANPLVVLHRAAFVDGEGAIDTKARAEVLRWATETGLGQEPGLLAMAIRRRTQALEARVRQGRGRLAWQRHHVTPQWRMGVGVGNRLNLYEIGLSLHGTYGSPIIPGSTIKGVTCAWARECGVDRDDPQRFGRIFGLPRMQAEEKGQVDQTGGVAARGCVVFFDALPLGGKVSVARDVVTPHQQPYYSAVPKQAPGEHHQPIPSDFLVVDGGTFAVDFLGPQGDVSAAATWCATALDELGVGAKTSAGYGYLTVREAQS